MKRFFVHLLNDWKLNQDVALLENSFLEFFLQLQYTGNNIDTTSVKGRSTTKVKVIRYMMNEHFRSFRHSIETRTKIYLLTYKTILNILKIF